MYVLLALLLLGVLIMVHEAGHYWAARACGIEVQEFAMGMGPQLLKWQNKRGTRFSLRILPIGGFCQFYGEDEANSDPRAFNNQAVWKRAITVVSGPLMNFLLALLVVVLYMSLLGIQSIVPRVAQIEENAEAAGLRVGDELLAIDGVSIDDTTVVTRAVMNSDGQPVSLLVRRDGEELTLDITPFYDEEAGRYRVGITFAQDRIHVPLLESLPFSFRYNVESVRLIVDALRNMLFKGEGIDEVTGPVGTVYVIQEVTQTGGIDIYLELAALISVNLGVMNLLPIPGLDGSRLLFLVVEGVRRKPIRRELEGAIHMAGFCLLMGLMIVLTYKDIMQIFVCR